MVLHVVLDNFIRLCVACVCVFFNDLFPIIIGSVDHSVGNIKY